MSFLLKNNIHTSIAKTFYDDILSQRNIYYYFLGRTTNWQSEFPPEIPDTFSEESDIRNNIVFMNKIGVSDICLVTKRIDWIANTTYDKYDENISKTNPSVTGATNIKNALFYVLTDEMNVYKCINNNSGTPSTVKPTGTSYDNIKLIDGYVWKYMFSVTPVLQYKFLTDKNLPVIRSLNTRYYEGQGIESVTINDPGEGYEGSPITTATVFGDGRNASISLSINPSTGSISNVIIKDNGNGYTTGYIEVIAVDSKGTGKYGNDTAILIPKFVDGMLDSVVIEDPGINYSTDMQTNIVVNGNGEGAVLYPIIENGKLIDVIIENPGYGYTEVSLSIESVTGSGASISVSSSIGNIDSIQSDIELLAVPGAIYVVDVGASGKNYSYATCVIEGDGEGLNITPVLYNSKVIGFNVNNPGKNYTWCKIHVVGDGEGAVATPIFSPIKGHGNNAINELFADTISIYSTIKFNMNQPLLLNNDYRQFGIIKNPEKTNQTSLYRGANSTTCYTISVDTAENVYMDQELFLSSDNTKKFLVVGSDKKNKILIQSFGGVIPTPGMKLLDSVNNSLYVINEVELPQVNKLSGELIFVDNRTSITQTNEQFISLRTNLKF